MVIDMDWSPDFCLACETQTDGSVYCSFVCNLADYEKASHETDPTTSSPTSPQGPVSQDATRPATNGFYIGPPYNVSKGQPDGTGLAPRSPHYYKLLGSQLWNHHSMHSSTGSAASAPIQFSEESKKALRAYDSSFVRSRTDRLPQDLYPQE
jgi:hypothetical protein